jgi:hypothetical protein
MSSQLAPNSSRLRTSWRPTALELVDRDGVGEVEHVDLLELGRGAELRRHHVQRVVDERHDGGVALADAGRFDDHEVEPGRLEHGDGVGEPLGQPALGAAGGHRPEEDVLAGEAVHPDPVTEQRAAALAPGGVDGEHGDAELVLLVEAEAAHQLVGERGLAGAAGAGDAEHRDGAPGGEVELGGQASGLDEREGAGQGRRVARVEAVERRRRLGGEVDVALPDHQVDHPGQTEPLAVLGGEDAGHAPLVQQLDLARHDHATAAAVDPDVPGAALAQQFHQVGEVLDVPALVRADRDALRVLLERGRHDLVDRPVVAEVHHLRALALEDAPHDVDRRVVAVEEARRTDEADGVRGHVQVRHAI